MYVYLGLDDIDIKDLSTQTRNPNKRQYTYR